MKRELAWSARRVRLPLNIDETAKYIEQIRLVRHQQLAFGYTVRVILHCLKIPENSRLIWQFVSRYNN
jgi:hypothetical protein